MRVAIAAVLVVGLAGCGPARQARQGPVWHGMARPALATLV